MQWEELQGSFEQADYLREILKDHIWKQNYYNVFYSNTGVV